MIVDSLSEFNRNLYYQQQPPVIPATDEAAQEMQGVIRPMKPTAVGAKNHVVGFHTDDDRYTFFVNVAEMMYRAGIIKSNSVSALLQHAAFETCNMYLLTLMGQVRQKQAEEQEVIKSRGGQGRSPYYHIEEPEPVQENIF